MHFTSLWSLNAFLQSFCIKALTKKPWSENALSKRKVFNLDLKQSTVEHCLMTFGKSFQSLGVITEKDLLP